ncbi:MAG: hypothetical protein JXR07_08930 [Reichenbachiella sp.]
MKKLFLLSISLIFLFPISSFAQDAHYWTEQFGNRSTLLAGSVVGSVEDLGAVFYNPGRLALQEDPTFLISAKAFQLVKLGVKDAAGEADLSNDKFGSAPTLAAGSFNLDSVKFLKFFHGHKFAYAFLSRTNFDYTLSARLQQTYAFNANWPGEEDLYGNVSWNKSVKEEWMGLTWAIPLNTKWAIGLTNFVSTYNESATYENGIQAIANENVLDPTLPPGQQRPVANFSRNRNRSMTTLGYIAKIGLSYDIDWLSLGLTLTTPKAIITSSGTALFDEALAGYEFARPPSEDDPGSPNNILISNATSEVEVQNKSPMSIAFGAGLKLGKNKLHLSAEWFDKVDQYYSFVPEPFEAQSSGTIIRNRYVDKRKSVINFGAGIELVFSEKVSGYASFATDFSSLEKTTTETGLDSTDNLDNSIFTADIYHYGGGFALDLKKMDLTLGVIYSRGVQPAGQVFRFPIEEGSVPPEDPPKTDLLWERFRILLGFALPFYKFGS